MTFENKIKEFEDNYKEKFDGILISYEEKIRISGPAKYWQEMEEHYTKKGNWWRNLAAGIGVVTTGFISIVFFNYPATFITDNFIQGLKGTLLLGIGISTLIYILRMSIKMSLSNYHLSIDSKERHQLSHFYLALLKEGAIAKEDRNLILQSLFGRADSGLLHGDSAPTLPTDLSTLKSLISK
ncbi:hypothetical protein CH375_21795 [Leptospira ellisii]|nr:hypothetical protein CH375_21795 [Leptospira ellisii]